MSLAVVRFEQAGHARWGVLHGDRIAVLTEDYASTGDLLRHARPALADLTPADATLPVEDVRLLSPITADRQFVCQGINYESHVRESGLDPADIPFNLIFTKAPSCLSGAHDDVVRPSHVKLLDYEVELGLVIGKDITGPIDVTDENLGDWLAGVTIVNDISARDVQLPQGQFYKGKSYRTFGPTGPVLLLLEAAEWKRWREFEMHLAVNGETRQKAACAEMIYSPPATLTELSALQDFSMGDLIATGTPAGCAAVAPGKFIMFLTRHFMSEATKWKLFTKKAATYPRYLRPGDEIRTTIRTADGAIDLGEQRNRVTGN